MQLLMPCNQQSYSLVITGTNGTESASGSDNDSDAESSIHDLLKQTKQLLIESHKESREHQQQAMANAANLTCNVSQRNTLALHNNWMHYA